MGSRLTTSQQCALMAGKADASQGCSAQTVASRVEEVLLPSSALGRACLELWVQLWAPPFKADRELQEGVQWVGKEMIGAWCISCVRKDRALGLFSLERRRRLRGSYQCLQVSEE